jgi:two-component system, OmpR family, KDP operon response regulator KdpE
MTLESVMGQPTVLVVDDDPGILNLVEDCLANEHWIIHLSKSGLEALAFLDEYEPDLVILDLRMKPIDGFEILRRIRSSSGVLIIILSALSSDEDKERCLEMGADDYMTKPFSLKEFTARCRSMMRRSRGETVLNNKPYYDGILRIDFAERRAFIEGKDAGLTNTEFTLLHTLAASSGKIMTYIQILDAVWGAGYGETKSVHVFVNRLRRKIEPNPMKPTYIITYPSVGYRFEPCKVGQDFRPDRRRSQD